METFNKDLEKAVLGGLMAHPDVVDDLSVRPGDFYEYRHEQLFRLLVGEVRSGAPVDPVSVSAKASEIKGIEFAYLFEMFESAAGSGVKTMRQAEMLADISSGRALKALSGRIGEIVEQTPVGELDGSMDTVRADLDNIANRTSKVEVKNFTQLLDEAMSEWNQPPDRNVLRTGWVELDDYLNGGFRQGQLTILGARPAVGKSAIACCMAVANHMNGVGFFSLEMPAVELVNRMTSIETGVELSRLTTHDLRDYEWNKIHKFRSAMSDWNLWLEDRPRRTISQMRATLRTWKRHRDIKLVIVDYLQLMAPADSKEQRERQVSRMAEDLKAMAKDFDVAVVALAQVGRGAANRDDKRPTMSDLRESGGIEANADQILLLHREESRPHEVQMIVAKNRHGSVGIIKLVWSPAVSSAYSEPPNPQSYPFGTGFSYE